MLISEYLDRAAVMLEAEGGWCQGAAAKTADGKPAAMGSEEAMAHCMDGALYEVSLTRSILIPAERYTEYNAAIQYLEAHVKVATTKEENGKKTFQTLVEFNDDATQTQANVVNFIKKSAEAARVEGK